MTPVRALAIVAQAWWLRRTIEVLPPADGPTFGRTGDLNIVDPLRVGILGESTAAGCGVALHKEGFAAAMASGLHQWSGRPVSWEVVGQHGATSRRIRYRLLPQLDSEYELVVLLAGANDVLSRRSTETWREDLTAIVDVLSYRARHVVVIGAPPFAAFPSLPRALRAYLAQGGQAIDIVAQQVCDSRLNAQWIGAGDIDEVGADFFARDGFHPSAHGYRRWAEIVLTQLPPLEDWSGRGAVSGTERRSRPAHGRPV